MEILFLIDNLRPGGAQKALLAMTIAARQAGHQPAVWCLGGTSSIEKQFADNNIPVLGKPSSALQTALEPFAILHYLRRNRIALLQTFLFHSDVTGRVLGALAGIGRAGHPKIIGSVRASNIKNRWWQFLLLRATAPLADAFTAVSTRTLEFAAGHEGLARARARVIPNGIDLSEWEKLPDAGTSRAGFGLAPSHFVISTIGRLHEQKGHEYLLCAAQKIIARVPNAVFLIAGYGPLEQRLKQRARELGVDQHVRFLGYRTDIHNILSASDLFVLPSLWEGMSNALLEAMAAGKPVIATAIDGNLDQITDGDTGLLIPPRDAEALAAAILKLVHDPNFANSLATRARDRVRRDFSLDATTRAYLQLYSELLK